MINSSHPAHQSFSAEHRRGRTEVQDAIHQAVAALQAQYDVSLTTAYMTLVQASADADLTVSETAARIIAESLETSGPGPGLHPRTYD